MIKKKKNVGIFSVVLTLVLLCFSAFFPLVNKKQGKVYAGEVDNTLYAFVTKQNNKVNDGKIYVDFGLSIDFDDDGAITRSDAEEMVKNDIIPFETAKIYLRTRNMSAIAEQGDYEAIDQTFIFVGNNPSSSIAIKVNNSGLQVGDATRQFYVEIYKVEITGLKEGYTFNQPNTTKEISTETLSTGSEFHIDKKTISSSSYTLSQLDLAGYFYLTSLERVCSDVKSSTSFGDIKLDLANVGNGWYNKIKYLSDNDMLKLGVRVTLSAYEAANSVYTDNSYVGIQIFAGDSNGVGAPALEGVPEKNIYNHNSIVELSRWFAKFQSDEREGLGVAEAFNGKFEGVTVSSLFDENVYIPHAIATKDYGQGGVFDAYVGEMDDYRKNMFIIDDLDVFHGSTTISIRVWKYLSRKAKFYDGFLLFVPTNYRAQVESATLGKLYKDENGKEKIGVSLRFSEPVQLKKYGDGREVSPYIEGYINGNASNEVKFEYVSGEGTDTLYFETDVSNYKMNITRISLKTAQGFEDVYDFPPSCGTGGTGYNNMSMGAYQYLNVMIDGVVNGWDDISAESLSCSYDLRVPEIDTNGSISQTVRTSHTTTIRTAYVSEKGKLYYGWTEDDQTVPENLSVEPILEQGFQTISSPSKVSGTRYLYAIAISDFGKQSKPLWIGPFNFDNEAPILSIDCTKNTYKEKQFNINIKNNSIEGFRKFASLNESVKVIVSSDAKGENPLKVFSIPIAEEKLQDETVTVENFTLTAEMLGLQDGYGTYYVSFEVSDGLENRSVSEPVSYYFDVREIFDCEIVKDSADPEFEMDEFITGANSNLVLERNYFTLDLSKKDLVEKDGQEFYFNIKSNDDTVSSLAIEEFKNVSTGVSILSDIEQRKDNGIITVMIKNKFDAGLYCLIIKDATEMSNKQSLPIYFYVTNGKDDESLLYQDYKSDFTSEVFTNRVFQIPTSVPFYYLTDMGVLQTQSYSNTNRPVSFSSWASASSYVLYREYLDLYAITATQSFANDLNNGIYRKAEGVNVRAEAGQVWIRYKEVNWRPNSTTSEWVYYYYGEDQSSLPVNINVLSNELQIALNTVAGMICSYGGEVDLVTEEYFDKYGAPKLSADQMHLDKEESSVSMSGTAFKTPIEYFGDKAMYISLDADAPLATNAIFQTGENKRFYYKKEGSEYRPLIKDNRETFGEYFNATGKFTILELNEKGVREYSIYIDKTAPKVAISWETQSGTQSKEFSTDDSGQTISGNNFYIRSIEDYDTLAFVAIYRYTGQGEGDLLNVYRKSNFDDGQGIRLDDGKYHVYISDRSGNSYSFILQMKSDPLVCSVKEVANSYIRIEMNRNESEIRYQVFLDGWLLTSDYNDKRFTESGQYRFLIEDIYGNVYDETYIFERDIPAVTWRYQTADGNFVLYEEDNDKVHIQKIDDKNFIIATSTYLRFIPLEGCAYEITSGKPSPSQNPSTGWVTLNNMTTFTMKVYYELHPNTYVIYTCTIDNSAPQVNVSYQKGYYQAFELEEIKQTFASNGFSLGDNAFIPSSIGFESVENNATALYVSNGQRVQSKYFKVQVSDESGVKDVKVYLNGELILTKDSDFSNIYLSRRGSYQIIATDNFSNTTTFTFTNDYDERVEYFVDGEQMSTDVQFAENFEGTTYKKVEYGNTKTEIKILSSVEVHYIITDAEGNPYYFAFVVEDGELYTYQYVISVITIDNGENGLEIENISSRGVKALASGMIAKIDKIGVAIFLSKNNDGSFFLTVNSVDDVKKTYTVETRISVSQNEMPYYFKTKISTIPSSVEFVDGNGDLLNTNQTIKVNESFAIRRNIDADVQSVQVAYSQTGDYAVYETVYDGKYYDFLFSDEGMYHVKVVNRYGIQTDYYVIISAQFVMTATVEYLDGTTLTYSSEYTKNNNDFYSNKSIEFIVYSTNIKVLNKHASISVIPTEQGYTVIYIDKVGEYHLAVEDEFGNMIEKDVFIAVDTLEINENLLTNFNEKALRRDENYTNQKVLINKNAIIGGNKIAFVGMTYGDKTITVYDELSERKTAFDENQCVGLLGNGEYKIIFRDRYGNKAETVIYYCGTPTLTIIRKTLNGVGSEIYSIEEMLANGVWTNDTVNFSISASEYILTVDGMSNVTSISYDAKTKNEYEVYYLDEFGFEYTFKVYLHRENVVITPAESMSVSLLSDLFVTKNSVQVNFTENALCTYTLNNETEKEYNEGDLLYKDGIYRFKVVDKAGNISTYTVKKDSAVEYRLEGSGASEILINGGITNGNSVKFIPENSDNAYIKKVFHNNEFIEYDDESFNERGKWELLVADDAGNESYFRFYVLYGKIDGFSYYTPYNYVITSVIWEMEGSIAEATETIKESGLLLEATENGKYTVTMESLITGDVKTFNFTIDKTPSQVQLVGCHQNEKTINNITLKGCSVGDTIYVYKDNKLVKTVRIESAYMDAPTINEAGKYRIVVENEAGIKTELAFERKYVPNVAGSVLIIVLALAAVVGLFVGLVWRNHSKTDD